MKSSLGQLEQRVMDIVWEKKLCSTREILIVLKKERKIAYTTVATILQRLHHKELLNREKKNNGYIYFPKLTREKYTKNIARLFLKNFVGSFGNIGIASFAESVDKLPQKKKKYFLKILEEHDKNK
ncbi:MAG: hypothetical protein COU25_02985 [Candidatus Levybacteria bacterium CG10_big_fil_rev_8_21_14_0_10_35_13]|nr:MAG: hypothetical protein COU25_02985 [Candidatus Levybacteria bacterium CG10_big_fil_rev_8_21_14_0_10_35_13]